MKTGSTNWGLAWLTAATLAVVLPFLAFMIFAIVTPDNPAQGARNVAAIDRSGASARTSPATSAPAPSRAVSPAGEVVRKRRT